MPPLSTPAAPANSWIGCQNNEPGTLFLSPALDCGAFPPLWSFAVDRQAVGADSQKQKIETKAAE